jgi:hypothetical protein
MFNMGGQPLLDGQRNLPGVFGEGKINDQAFHGHNLGFFWNGEYRWLSFSVSLVTIQVRLPAMEDPAKGYNSFFDKPGGSEYIYIYWILPNIAKIWQSLRSHNQRRMNGSI